MDKKRIRKIRKIKNRRRKILINRSIIIFTFFAFVGLVCFGFFKLVGGIFSLDEVYVTGNTYYDKEAILEAAGAEKGGNLLFLDTSEAEAKICRKLAYIESAKVTKKLPNRLEIKTEVAQAHFSLLGQDGYYIMSKNHKLLEKKEEQSVGLVAFSGAEFSVSENLDAIYKDSQVKELIDLVLSSLEKNHLLNIKEVSLAEKGRITLDYDGRVKLVLGSKDDMDYKILTAREVINGKLRQDEKGTLDLSSLGVSNRSYFTKD